MRAVGIPEQYVPETSSVDRMHVLDESCWCGPIRSSSQGELSLHHRGQLAVGDRVAVDGVGGSGRIVYRVGAEAWRVDVSDDVALRSIVCGQNKIRRIA